MGRRERQREARRRDLLAVALELFERQGFEATTIDQIAERADVARQTVLNHYPTKMDFVRAWGARRRAEVQELDAASTGSMSDRLHGSYDVLATINERERDLTRMLRGQILAPQPIPPAIRQALDDGARTGELAPSADPRRAAEIIAAIYVDTLHRWLQEQESSYDLREELHQKLDAALSGLLG